MLNNALHRIDVSTFNPLRFTGFMFSLPEIIVIEPTNYCNASCLKCLRHYKKLGRNQGFLSIDDLKNILAKMPLSIKFIGINGFGEPLMHPQFAEILKTIHQHDPNIKMGFHTNGILLNDAIISACIEYGVSDIEISVDSNIKETYQKLHSTKFAFKKLEENIKNVVSSRNQSNSDLRIGVAYILQYENRGQLPGFIGWAHRIGVDFVGPIKPVNPLLGYNIKLWNDSFSDMKKEIRLAKEVSDKLNFEVQYPDFNEKKAGSANISSLRHFSCSFPYTLYPIITWDGYAMPCAWIQDVNYNCGNILEVSFFNVWNGKKIRKIRKAFAKNKYLRACENCKPGNFDYQDMEIDE